jgi:hypothetical protein
MKKTIDDYIETLNEKKRSLNLWVLRNNTSGVISSSLHLLTQ